MLENRWARKRTTWRKTGIEKDTRFSGLVAERDAAACCRTSLGRGKRGILVKGGETAADRGHGRRGEVAINKYTENRQRERERERERVVDRATKRRREKEKKIGGEREGWRGTLVASVRPSVRSCVPKAPTNLTDARSFATERERKRDRDTMERDYGRVREVRAREGSGERLWLRRQGQLNKQGQERERERDGIQGCEERSRKREEGQRRVGSRRWGNEINEIPSNAMEPRIEEEPFAKGTHEHYCLANSELSRSSVSTEFLVDEESANRFDVVE